MNRKSPDVFADVTKFFEIAQPEMLVPLGKIPSHKALELAFKLIEEECVKEYMPALQKFTESPTRENLIEVIDGAMDSIYVIAWAMRLLNVPSQAMWNEVQRSNMAKFTSIINKIPQRHKDAPQDIEVEVNERNGYWVICNKATGKVVKPEGWTQPDLFAVLQEYETINKLRTQHDMIADIFFHDYFHEMESRREQDRLHGE